MKAQTKSDHANELIQKFSQVILDELELSGGDTYMRLGSEFLMSRKLLMGDALRVARILHDKQIIRANTFPNYLYANGGMNVQGVEIYILNKKKLNEIADIKNGERPGKITEFNNKTGVLTTPGYAALPFERGLRRAIISFFYELGEERKNWKSNAEIKATLNHKTTKQIREQVAGINKRFKGKNGTILIDVEKENPKSPTSPNKYRWAL